MYVCSRNGYKIYEPQCSHVVGPHLVWHLLERFVSKRAGTLCAWPVSSLSSFNVYWTGSTFMCQPMYLVVAFRRVFGAVYYKELCGS